MRYKSNETTYILATYPNRGTITINIYRISDGAVIVNAGTMTEIGTTTVFQYLFSDNITSKTEYLWIATDGVEEQKGKVVLGGYIDDVLTDTNYIILKGTPTGDIDDGEI